MKPKIQLHENEKMLFECQPKKSLIGYLYLTRFLHTLLLLSIFFMYVSKNRDQSLLSWMRLVSDSQDLIDWISLIVIVSLLGIVWCVTMVHKHWYFFTDQRCVIYAGFWGINQKIVPYSRVVDVDMNRNPFRGAFGISAVYLDQQGLTASGSLFSTRTNNNATIIDGLTNELAEKITNLISSHMSRK